MSDVVTLHAPEVRTMAAELMLEDVESDGRRISGRAVPYSTFASIGWFAEQHAPKSFAKSIREAAEKLPLLLWHNNASFPVGVSEEWDDNDAGLDCTWLMDHSEEAERAVHLAEEGMLTGLSIGFAPIRSEWEYVPDADWNPDRGVDGMDKVTRLESRLLEVSLTPTPAFAGAKVSQVRSREKRREIPNRHDRFPRREAWAEWLEANRRGRVS